MTLEAQTLQLLRRLPRPLSQDFTPRPITPSGRIFGYAFTEAEGAFLDATTTGLDSLQDVGIVRQRPTRFGVGAEFNGESSFIEFSNDAATFDRQAWTVELLFTAGELTGLEQAIWDDIDADTGFLAHIDAAGELQFTIGDGTVTTFATGITCEPGTEYHLIVTYNSGAVIVYVAGESEATGTKTYAHSGDAEAYFGAASDVGGDHFRGTIDLANFYNRTLTPAQAATRYMEIQAFTRPMNQRILTIPATEIEDGLARVTDYENSRFIETATGGALDRYGNPRKIAREGDTDLFYRIRLLAEYKTIYSRGTRAEIVEFVASALNVDPMDVNFVENEDVVTSLYRARYYYIEVPITGLVDQGLTEQADLTEAFNLVEALLQRVEAGGVRGVFKAFGSFYWEGDGGDFGASGVGTAANGWSNSGIYEDSDFGPTNEGGHHGGFT